MKEYYSERINKTMSLLGEVLDIVDEINLETINSGDNDPDVDEFVLICEDVRSARAEMYDMLEELGEDQQKNDIHMAKKERRQWYEISLKTWADLPDAKENNDLETYDYFYEDDYDKALEKLDELVSNRGQMVMGESQYVKKELVGYDISLMRLDEFGRNCECVWVDIYTAEGKKARRIRITNK